MRNVCMKVRIPKAKNFNIQRTHGQLMHIYNVYRYIIRCLYYIKLSINKPIFKSRLSYGKNQVNIC